MQALSVLLPQVFSYSKDLTPSFAKPEEEENFKPELDTDEEIFEGQDFTFSCANPQGSLIYADEIFDNGHIRPIFSNFDQCVLFVDTQKKETPSLRPPIKKLFIAHHKCNPSNSNFKLAEPCWKWPEKITISEVETSNVSCKKSNSTGFSKQWRFRKEPNLRSNSEGKDAFVFLNPLLSAPSKEACLKDVKYKNVPKNKTKEGKHKTTLSAYEKHYGMKSMRMESDKRKSFLPYKQVLVGLFANADRFSKNMHPF